MGRVKAAAIGQIGVSELTFDRTRITYGGVGADQLNEMMQLLKARERRRQAVAELALDKQVLAEAGKGNAPRKSTTSDRKASCTTGGKRAGVQDAPHAR